MTKHKKTREPPGSTTHQASNQERVLAVQTYEAMFIWDSNRFSRDPSVTAQQVQSMVEKAGGEVLASRLWDDGRKLAYPIDGHKKGTYWITYFTLEPTRLHEINRACQLNDSILRHLFIKLDPRVAGTLVSVARGDIKPQPEEPVAPAAPAGAEPVAAAT
jgi:small subunit ribosomal protein S6